jgi:hypothetical protein
MRSRHYTIKASLIVLGMLTVTSAQQSSATSQHQQQAGKQKEQHKSGKGHDSHHAGVNRRGDQVMGFDHAKTTHHFRLKTDGGIIEVNANDPNDTASRDQIRMHLKHITHKFAEGDFTAPMLIHAQTPPGVPEMKRQKAEIKYQFEESERGGLVRITTSNVKAVEAVHKFLRFQIKDHRTGDSGEVENRIKAFQSEVSYLPFQLPVLLPLTLITGNPSGETDMATGFAIRQRHVTPEVNTLHAGHTMYS